MQTQTIFKAGNSNVVAIPKHLMKELGLKKGEKVVVEKEKNKNSIIIKKVSGGKAEKIAKGDFKKWLDVFLQENGDILDELATR